MDKKKLIIDIYKVLFFFSILTIPFGIVINNYFLLAFAVSLICKVILLKKIKVEINLSDYFLLSFIMTIILHCFFEKDFYNPDLIKVSSLLFLTTFFKGSLLNDLKINNVLKVLILSAALVFIGSIVYAFSNIITNNSFYYLDENYGWKYYYLEYTRISIFGHPTYISILINVAVSSLLFLKMKKFPKLLIIAVLMIFIFLLQSKTGILSLVCILIAAFFLKKLYRKKVLMLISGTVFVSLLFFAVLKGVELSRIQNTYLYIKKSFKNGAFITDKSSNSNRIELLKYISNLKFEDLLLGQGYNKTRNLSIIVDSQLISYLLKYGLIGTIFFLVYLISLMRGNFSMLSFILVIPLFFSFLTENILERRMSLSLFIIIWLIINKKIRTNTTYIYNYKI